MRSSREGSILAGCIRSGVTVVVTVTPTNPLSDARMLLRELREDGSIETRALAEIAENAGWGWGPAVLASLLPAEPAASRRAPTDQVRGQKAHGLRVWLNLPEWQERAPPPPPGNDPVSPDEARQRLASLLGAGSENRPQQADYAAANLRQGRRVVLVREDRLRVGSEPDREDGRRDDPVHRRFVELVHEVQVVEGLDLRGAKPGLLGELA